MASTEAQIVNKMFGNNSEDDGDDDDMVEAEEEKYPYSSHRNSHFNDSEIEETNGLQFKGLKNQGATCYLNALLQSLYFTPELREGIYKLTEDELGIKDLPEADTLDEQIKNNKYQLKNEDIDMLSALGYTQTRV